MAQGLGQAQGQGQGQQQYVPTVEVQTAMHMMGAATAAPMQGGGGMEGNFYGPMDGMGVNNFAEQRRAGAGYINNNSNSRKQQQAAAGAGMGSGFGPSNGGGPGLGPRFKTGSNVKHKQHYPTATMSGAGVQEFNNNNSNNNNNNNNSETFARMSGRR